MVTLQRNLYQLILRLHPAAFRNRFAREMSLDFEDALATFGFSHLLLDATGSLARQWTTAPLFTASQPQAPAPVTSHPLLAGQYVVLEGDPLTPFEFLRGSLLFAALLFTLSLALKHGGNYIHAGHNVGLSGGAGDLYQPPSASNAVSHTPAPDYSQPLAIPTSSLPSRYGVADRNGHIIYVNPAAQAIGRQAESWKEFLTRCALITAIVWLTSFLLRRSRKITARIALVAAGLALVVFAAVVPLHLADTPAHAAILHPDPRPRFESATIHLRQDIPAAYSTTVTPGIDSATANPVHIDSPIRTLLADVSNLPPGSIIGGPDWLNKDTYQINGKPSAGIEAAARNMKMDDFLNQKRAMQQSLLVDRFHLKAHFETRILPVYELVPAKGGLKIAAVPAPPERKGPYAPVIHVSPDSLAPGSTVSVIKSDGLRTTNARAIPIEALARTISFSGATELEPRPIVNHTGFTGYFDIKDLTWAPLSTSASDTPSAPFLQRALEEQLGIKIQPARAPIEVLVIDSIERPTPN